MQDAISWHFMSPDPAPPEVTEHYESVRITSEVGDLTAQSQSTRTLVLHSTARATLLAGADLCNKARLLSLTGPQTRSWLLAVPCKLTLQLARDEFRRGARYRRGVIDHNH
jgi:hypothetical protein